jgi:hypothetical protein
MVADTKTNAYLLGNATLMMAPFGSIDPFIMTPTLHSIGMVKNVTLGVDSDNIQLTNGIQQNLVDSKRSNVKTTVSADVYEYNAQNLYYGLSINKTASAPKRGKLKNAVAGATATIVINTDPLPGQSATGISAVGDIPVGATILIQRAAATTGDNDYVFPVRVTAATTAASADYTVTVAIPAGLTFSAGDHVWVVNEVPVGTQLDQDFFQIKIAGTLANYEQPVVIILPKVKVRQGFQLNFSETDYGNMSFQFDPFYLIAAELSGRLTEIGTKQTGYVYTP